MAAATKGGEFQLTINEEFAKKYEAKKRAEELSALKEKYGDVESIDADHLLKAAERRRKYGISDVDQATAFEALCAEDDELESSEGEAEDEHAEMLTPEVDLQVMKALASIRAQDPKIYDSRKNFFTNDEIEKAKLQWKQKQNQLKKSRPFTLKDYHRETLLGEGSILPADGSARTGSSQELTHAEEQEQLKNEVKAALAQNGGGTDDGGDDHFFTKRTKSADEIAQEEEEYRQFLIESINKDGGKSANVIREWQKYAENSNVNEEESFLMNYVLNRGWLDKHAMKTPSYNEIVDDSSDEEEFNKAERFESSFNHRFEEEGGTQIVTHARNIDNLIRRKDNKRKLQRQSLLQRKEEERKRKDDELKRLKNLKKEEIRQRLLKIREVAGHNGSGNGGGRTGFGIDDVDLEATLEEDFDPSSHDRIMAKAFNEDYYNDENGREKPVFEDDIDISDLVADASSADVKGTGVAKPGKNSKKNKKKQKKKELQWKEEGEFIMDADYVPEQYDEGRDYLDESHELGLLEGDGADYQASLPTMKNKASAVKNKRSLEEYLDEYYQLDYEDMIGDLPTRFKYAPTTKADYGLTPAEILMAADVELNEFFSLRKLAPYRPDDKQEADRRKFAAKKKKRLREFRQQLEERVRQNPELSGLSARPSWRIGAAMEHKAEDERTADPRKRKRNEKRRERAKKARILRSMA